jgi:hypothetical protein
VATHWQAGESGAKTRPASQLGEAPSSSQYSPVTQSPLLVQLAPIAARGTQTPPAQRELLSQGALAPQADIAALVPSGVQTETPALLFAQ